MAGPEGMHVVLRLSLRARSLMIEEYPLSEADIREVGEDFFFDSWSCQPRMTRRGRRRNQKSVRCFLVAITLSNFSLATNI